ncbi:MAG: MFS transporter, partial [Actinobacteria bacterium]|nr:MFS transporter [Actinomycetota bacterium]
MRLFALLAFDSSIKIIENRRGQNASCAPGRLEREADRRRRELIAVITGENAEMAPLYPDRRNGEDPGGTSPTSAVNRIALSRAVTFSGGNAAFIALLFILFRETDSASVVALGALASFAVPALASPVAGWLGDRFDRRRVMVASEILGAVCFLLSAAVTSSPAELLILRMLASLAGAPLMSSTAGALPGVVRSGDALPA